MLAGERFEGEDLAAAQQRRVDREERVLRGRADQDDAALLDVGEEDVLLAAVEVVQFIDKEEGLAPLVFEELARFLQDFSDVLDPRRHGVEGAELCPGLVGDDVRQRGLAGARRPVEDRGRQSVGE